MYKIRGNDGKEYGPVPADQLHQWIREGRANAQTLVQIEGSTEWQPLGALADFASTLSAAAAAPATAQGAQAMATAPLKTNPLAITALIMGICALLFCCCYGLPFNILGIIFSLIAMSQIRSAPHLYTGKNLAIVGLVLSILSIVIAVLLVVFHGALTGLAETLRQMENR